MAKEEPMPHYERLLAAARAKRDGKQFLGHVLIEICTRGGRKCRRIEPVYTSGAPIEQYVIGFIRQCLWGPTGPEK